MLGILYCHKSVLPYQELRTLLTEHNIDTVCLEAETLPAENFTAGQSVNPLASYDVLLNVMDSYYPEEQLPLLVDYFNQGGHIINLCPAPFTVSLTSGQTNHRALRSFEIIDDFHPIKEHNAFLSTWYGETSSLSLTGFYGGVYHLCDQENGKNQRIAYLEHLMDAWDTEGRLLAAAMLRIVTHKKGSMTLCNFDLAGALSANNDCSQTAFLQKALVQAVKKNLAGTALLTIDSHYSRYTREEAKLIRISAIPLTITAGTTATLHLRIYQTQEATSDDTLVYETSCRITLPYETILSPVLEKSGLYRIEAALCTVSDVCPETVITTCTTGILVLTREELLHEVQNFHPMYIDESISSDYCVVDGKITAILGTTYFVTDVYRECFYSMNAWLCAKEMAQLSADGFNVLRSGNWYYIPEFYNNDGSIGERGKRAMETFFYLAAKQGFTVQFALGTVLLNQWDTSRSPIHDKGMRKKCMTLIRSFAEYFKDFKNVMMDIVNEPSYSNRGAWSPGKPSMEAGERMRWHEWLKEKYGTIQNLRTAWGESPTVLTSFDDVVMPENHLFGRGLARTEQRLNHTPLADFFAFARTEFSGWTKEIRSIVREIAPDMTVIMGRDETLRIPEQQTEVLAGSIDMVCWHQWNYNSDIFTEYLMNRVRGKICVAQELGMYKFDDIRSGKRHTDEEMVDKLNNKLLCAFGNFVQWQSHDDPFMWELSENSLGLYRADLSPTPSLQATRELVQAERSMQHLMKHRDYDKVKICTVYGTSYHFGVEHPFALQGMRNFTYAMFHELKEPSDFMLEHLFTKEHASAIGTPRLIILPAMQMLGKNCWKELLAYVENGAVLLVNGCIDKDEFFGADAKISALDRNYSTRNLRDFESIVIDGNTYTLDFRRMTGYADVSNLLDCGEIMQNSIAEYQVGDGTILYCPYPLELSTNTDAMAACYRYAIKKAQAANGIYHLTEGRPNILLHAASYENCTVYTLINEGPADSITFTDLRSGITYTVRLGIIGGGKLWINETGEILQKFGEMEVTV
ncbi:MAG: beta-galactosidase [Lachnospiraceae bacterium]|nr:beta-galactosidase [Lachnospiraceae bacterium]